MRVLIVEDEKDVTDQLNKHLGHFRPKIHTVIARSRSSGIEALRSDEFDFIICDLRLPPYDGGVDTAEAHGLAVYSEARTVCRGTPCLFFTGFGTSAIVREQLSAGGTLDILGTGETYPMTRLLTKDEFLDCVERVESFNTELATLDAILIDLSHSSCSLDQFEQRALRLLARRFSGTSIEASDLGGLSGAQTLRAIVKNDQGRERASYFVKIGLWKEMKKERENYHRYVTPLLRMGHYPALVNEIEGGIGKRAALSYQLADGYTENLFDVLEVSESEAIAVVEVLRCILNPWLAHGEREFHRIRDLRAQRIDDSKFNPYRDAIGSTESFEDIKQEMATSFQHGDLHGLNILCNTSGGVVVIDFGNVGPAPTCIDPIILELSVLFHKDSPFRNNSWPTIAQVEAWFDLDVYLRGCPFPDFIRKCREWACETGRPTELAPVVYTEAVRQLKYEDTNRERALGIARAAIRNGICAFIS